MIHLQSPIASFDLAPWAEIRERISLQGSFEVTNGEYDQILIEIDGNTGQVLYKVRIVKLKDCEDTGNVHVEVRQKGDARILSRANRGVAVFEDLDLENVLTIRIY
jgi:hypothetical protein